MPNELQAPGADLRQKHPEELVSLVVQLRAIITEKDKQLRELRGVINDLIDQRDAATLLNELCHF